MQWSIGDIPLGGSTTNRVEIGKIERKKMQMLIASALFDLLNGFIGGFLVTTG
jgi:hypothetical protein